jgi:hypothetical protein
VRPVPSGLMAPVTVDTSSPAARNRSLRFDKPTDLSSRADSSSDKFSNFSSRRSSNQKVVMLNSPLTEGQMLATHQEEAQGVVLARVLPKMEHPDEGDRSVHASPRLSVSRLSLRRQTATSNAGSTTTNFSSRAAPATAPPISLSSSVPEHSNGVNNSAEATSPPEPQQSTHNWNSILMDTGAPPEQQIALSGSSRSKRMSMRLRSLDSPAAERERSPPETPPVVSMTPRFVRPLDSPGMRFRELTEGKSKLKSTLDRALELVPKLDITKYHLIKEAFVKALVQLEQSTYNPHHGC